MSEKNDNLIEWLPWSIQLLYYSKKCFLHSLYLRPGGNPFYFFFPADAIAAVDAACDETQQQRVRVETERIVSCSAAALQNILR